jgi:hypothetical protein
LPDTSPTNKALTGRINKDIEKKGNTEAEQSAIKAEGIADNIKAKDEDGNGQEVEDDDDSAFGQLVLPPGHKKMVKSLVAQHFRDKESQEERKADIISGKGNSTLIVGEHRSLLQDRKRADHSLAWCSRSGEDNYRW